MQVRQAISIFRIFDVSLARTFYLDYLGFTLDWEHPDDGSAPRYMQVSRRGLALHLSEHHGDCSPGAAVFLWVEGLAEFHEEIRQKAYRYFNPTIEDAPWGAKLMKITDPFGNRILFNERSPAAAAK